MTTDQPTNRRTDSRLIERFPFQEHKKELNHICAVFIDLVSFISLFSCVFFCVFFCLVFFIYKSNLSPYYLFWTCGLNQISNINMKILVVLFPWKPTNRHTNLMIENKFLNLVFVAETRGIENLSHLLLAHSRPRQLVQSPVRRSDLVGRYSK